MKAYRYRLYPSEDQKVMLAKHFGSCRFVWNYFLDLNNKSYAETGKGSNYNRMSKELSHLKKHEEYQWLKETNAQSLQQSLMHLETAFKKFFKKLAEEPVFKGKHKRQSFTVPQAFKVIENLLYIPKFKKPIRMFKHRDFDGEVRSITISQEPSGKYHASILVYEQDPDILQMPVAGESAVGVDMGIKAFATLSDGIQIQKPKHIAQSEKKLVKAQRRLSRKKKGSHNRMKQRVRVARIQEHIANQRKDFLNRVSDVLTRAYDTIAVEDLSLKDMMNGNHRRAKAVADAGWYSFKMMLKTKASQRGKNFTEIGRYEPSTKMCSSCGHVKSQMKLTERRFVCDECGYTNDRDVNAAINIRRFALISEGVPTESGESTPVDRHASALELLAREGIRASVLVEAGSPVQ